MDEESSQRETQRQIAFDRGLWFRIAIAAGVLAVVYCILDINGPLAILAGICILLIVGYDYWKRHRG
jgi:hypothetical protein